MPTFHYSLIDTPLGSMVAISDNTFLYALEFADQQNVDKVVKRMEKKLKLQDDILPGTTPILNKISRELKAYFAGKNREFTTPLYMTGTPFQKKVWEALQKIPVGETRSYLDVASSIRRPTAFRAVARANATNPLSLIIPCHRVINHDGKLGGYGGGLTRKQWLLEHEKGN